MTTESDSLGALPDGTGSREPSQQAVSALRASIPNAVEDFARWLESGGGDNSAFALNQPICCSGQDCGCHGSSVGEYLAYEFREFGKTIAARAMADPQRLLWREDVEGICPTPGACWEYGETARCGPCAIKQAAKFGVQSDLSLPNLPEVYRLRRELAAAQGIEAGTVETEGLDAKHESPVAAGHAPEPSIASPNPTTKGESK